MAAGILVRLLESLNLVRSNSMVIEPEKDNIMVDVRVHCHLIKLYLKTKGIPKHEYVIHTHIHINMVMAHERKSCNE